jgi:hypothetical protein
MLVELRRLIGGTGLHGFVKNGLDGIGNFWSRLHAVDVDVAVAGHGIARVLQEIAHGFAKVFLLDEQRRKAWAIYVEEAKTQEDIWAVVIADELQQVIKKRGLEKKFVYVHEAVSDPAPFQFLLPLGMQGAVPVSYYCVAGGSLVLLR